MQPAGKMLASSVRQGLIPALTSSAGFNAFRQASSSARVLQEASVSSSDTQSSVPSAPAPVLPKSQSRKGSELSSQPIANNLPGPLQPSRVRPRTHNHHVATLRLQSQGADLYVQNLEFFTDFAIRVAYAMGIPTSRPASLPMRKSLWTVPRGPFVHKKSQENFERRTHAQVIKVWDANADVVDKWLHFLRIHAMYGVTMRAETYAHVPLGFGEQMLAASTSQLRAVPDDVLAAQAAEATVRASEADSNKIRQLADNIIKEEIEQPEINEDAAGVLEAQSTADTTTHTATEQTNAADSKIEAQREPLPNKES